MDLRNNQNNIKPDITLVTMTRIAIYNPTKKIFDQYTYFFLLVKILLINSILLTKYALG